MARPSAVTHWSTRTKSVTNDGMWQRISAALPNKTYSSRTFTSYGWLTTASTNGVSFRLRFFCLFFNYRPGKGLCDSRRVSVLRCGETQ